MSLVTVSEKRRVYVRKFDHDEARARHAAGESCASLARAFGVSVTGVYRVVSDAYRAKAAEHHAAWMAAGECVDCGAACSRGHDRCSWCAHAVTATSVREGELWCSRCERWKPDDEFPRHHKRVHRRGRHKNCRPCITAMRRDYRERHKVPCVSCGKLRLPKSEIGRHHTVDTGLCRDCYMASRRAA